jgi:thiol-disulfide isomerase/thioredoxin
MTRIFGIALFFLCNLAFGQPATKIKIENLEKLIADPSKKIHIINFWATWCGPCVKELPLFEKVTAEGAPDVRVTLVSLDLDLDPNPEKVYRFIALKKIQSDVVLLDESDSNSWINKIDARWSGELPATIIINHETGKRKFIGKALHEGELEQYLKEIE